MILSVSWLGEKQCCLRGCNASTRLELMAQAQVTGPQALLCSAPALQEKLQRRITARSQETLDFPLLLSRAIISWRILLPPFLGEMAQEGGSEMLCHVTAEKWHTCPPHPPLLRGGQAGAGGPSRTRSIPRLRGSGRAGPGRGWGCRGGGLPGRGVQRAGCRGPHFAAGQRRVSPPRPARAAPPPEPSASRSERRSPARPWSCLPAATAPGKPAGPCWPPPCSCSPSAWPSPSSTSPTSSNRSVGAGGRGDTALSLSPRFSPCFGFSAAERKDRASPSLRAEADRGAALALEAFVERERGASQRPADKGLRRGCACSFVWAVPGPGMHAGAGVQGKNNEKVLASLLFLQMCFPLEDQTCHLFASQRCRSVSSSLCQLCIHINTRGKRAGKSWGTS